MIECVLSSNDIRMYYIDGKHVSKEYMKLYVKKFNSKMPYCKGITENTKLNRLKKKVIELKNKLSSLSKTITSKDYIESSIDIQKLKDEISTEKLNYLKNEDKNSKIISSLIQNENDLKDMISRLEDEKTIINANFNKYKKDKEEDIINLKNNIKELEDGFIRMKNELEKQKDSSLNEEQKIKDLNYKVAESENIIINLKQDNSKLNELNDEIVRKNKKENEDFQIIKLRLDEYQKTLDKLEVENKVLKGELNNVILYNDKEKKELSSLLKEKEDELVKLRDDIKTSINESNILILNDSL